MKIIEVDTNIINKLRNSGISDKMKTFESCSWLVLEEHNEKIIGVAGMGGLFHISSIYIDKNFRGKGLGKTLQQALINEAKKRGYSFAAVFIDPTNVTSAKLHDFFGYKTIFRIHYSSQITQEIKIYVLKSRGRIIERFLSFFNTLIGIFILACILKILKPLFTKVISYNEKQIPDPNIKWIIKNFEKI